MQSGIRDMYFTEIPPYLKDLSTVEMALISRITVVMNVHKEYTLLFG